ncbi:MAG: hypothetical protein ACRCSQ_05205, partial [Bacteroidales bacterium]
MNTSSLNEIYESRLESLLYYAYLRNKMLPIHADFLSKVNEVELSTPEKIAFRILKAGKVETAIELYKKIKESDITHSDSDFLIQNEVPHSGNKRYEAFLIRKASILQYAGGKENFAESERILKTLAGADFACLQNILPYIDYLIERSEDISPDWITKMIRACKNEAEESCASNRAGIEALRKGRIQEADSCFSMASLKFQIFKESELYDTNHPATIDYLKSLNSISNGYNHKKMSDSSIAYFKKAIELNRQRLKHSKETIIKPFFRTYSNYIAQLQHTKAYKQARTTI